MAAESGSGVTRPTIRDPTPPAATAELADVHIPFDVHTGDIVLVKDEEGVAQMATVTQDHAAR